MLMFELGPAFCIKGVGKTRRDNTKQLGCHFKRNAAQVAIFCGRAIFWKAAKGLSKAGKGRHIAPEAGRVGHRLVSATWSL